MGYRLEISKMKHAYCAGKLYGYTTEEDLKSYKWLLEHEYITEKESWTYECNPQIVLNAKEFKEFIELYNEDLKEEYKETEDFLIDDEKMQELINDNCDKVLEWI